MNLPYILSLIAGISISGLLLFAVVYSFMKSDIQKYFVLKSHEETKQERMHLLPLRLQAHERLIVFVERLNPAQLFVRLYQPGMSAVVLQALILNEIRSEYQHNVTQQLYISTTNWNVVRKLKDDTIAMINNAVSGMQAEASGVELSKIVLGHLSSIEENPYDLTLELIKKDIQQLC